MNRLLDNHLLARRILLFTMYLAAISSTACNIQTKPALSNSAASPDVPVPQNTGQGKCKSPEETKDSPSPLETKLGALTAAAFDHKLAAVKKLLKQGADPNEKDSLGNTPLLSALAIHILESQTMPPAKDPAFERDRKKTLCFQSLIVEELLKNKADANLAGSAGTTPMLEAVQWTIDSQNSLKILSLLMQYKADVNSRDDGNFTALMYAARKDKLEIVQFLLAHHARTDLKGCAGETALSIAQANKDEKMIELLQNAK